MLAKFLRNWPATGVLKAAGIQKPIPLYQKQSNFLIPPKPESNKFKLCAMCHTRGQAICELKHMPLSGEEELDSLIKKWVHWDRNPETLNQIMEAVKNEQWETLRSRLTKRLEFGTAGLRGIMRAGFDSMNELVIVQTAQGLCEYIKQQYPDSQTWSNQGIVIGYDGRYNSQVFAELTAIVFLNSNFRVHLFNSIIATPFIPYSILTLKCLAGVMVTASHNPKQDNGYKVYWTNGTQVIPPHDVGIHESILANLTPKDESWDETSLCENDMLCDPYDTVVPAYYNSLKNEISPAYMESNANCPVNICYTAMHGVGYPFIKLAFAKVSLKDVVPVVHQIKSDPEFPTTPKPNPEEGKGALKLAIHTAKKKKCEVILANDPDADRLAVAELDRKVFKLFTGNELGALLGWWTLENYKLRENTTDVSNCVMISSTVSSKILKTMAAIENFRFHETLTGFKWIGNKAIEEQAAGRKVLFGFEEAIGYMVSTNVFDKDGISAATHAASMVCYLRCKKCMTLQEKLRDIYETYGYHHSIGSYVICDDPELIKEIFERLRRFDNNQENTYPTSILHGEFPIENVRDLTTGYDSSTPDKKTVLPASSNTQMITFTFKNGAVITLRTSGTEPKMKYYSEISGLPENKRWEELKNTLERMVEAAVEEFYDPDGNGLERKVEE